MTSPPAPTVSVGTPEGGRVTSPGPPPLREPGKVTRPGAGGPVPARGKCLSTRSPGARLRRRRASRAEVPRALPARRGAGALCKGPGPAWARSQPRPSNLPVCEGEGRAWAGGGGSQCCDSAGLASTPAARDAEISAALEFSGGQTGRKPRGGRQSPAGLGGTCRGQPGRGAEASPQPRQTIRRFPRVHPQLNHPRPAPGTPPAPGPSLARPGLPAHLSPPARSALFHLGRRTAEDLPNLRPSRPSKVPRRDADTEHWKLMSPAQPRRDHGPDPAFTPDPAPAPAGPAGPSPLVPFPPAMSGSVPEGREVRPEPSTRYSGALLNLLAHC
ncbi:translation initiation factor IF-2-like isoform X3 [Strigops habroptila]|uniref:translation initiation factor IF-2-like isoform X3 n=1 Tax=Strigops habroptila TaxID=2489341 RepID=UPI0011CF8430|nr:translation initiation factor IF-2-like isoform X3 [Strigops habroptila]